MSWQCKDDDDEDDEDDEDERSQCPHQYMYALTLP
jgi:hypothetical protein